MVLEVPFQIFDRVLSSSFKALCEISYWLKAELKIDVSLILVVRWWLHNPCTVCWDPGSVTHHIKKPAKIQNSYLYFKIHIQNLGIFRTKTYIEPNGYLEFCETSKVELFSKIVEVKVFSKHFMLGVWQGPEYPSICLRL